MKEDILQNLAEEYLVSRNNIVKTKILQQMQVIAKFVVQL